MGDAEVRLFQSWVERLATADEPLEVWYEQIWAPDIDHRAIEGAPDDVGPIVGRDAMRAYLADWYEMFPDLTVVADEIKDAGDGRVIVIWHVAGTAQASGVPTELRLAVVYTIRGGRIVRGREYMTKDEALAAVANDEKDGNPGTSA
jgi:ketosteroid isomerase-like protein